MMTMPNPPKPNEVKRRTGNPGKRPLPKPTNVVALPMAHETPEPPRPLGPEGRKLWDRIWAAGSAWISPSTDLDHVTILCETMDERTALRLTVLRGSDWRDRVALRQIDHQLVTLLSSLAFNPTERTRLGLAEVKAQSKLAELRERSSRA